MDGRRGFSMVELLMVLVLVSVLSTLAISQFAAYRQRAYNSAALADLGNLKHNLETYFAEHHEFPTY